MHSFDTDFAPECQNCAILTLSCKIVEETSLLLTRWSWREGPGGRGKHASLANYNLAGICSATTTMSVVNTNTNTSADNYKSTGTCSATIMSVVNVLYRLVHTFTKPLNLAGTCNSFNFIISLFLYDFARHLKPESRVIIRPYFR